MADIEIEVIPDVDVEDAAPEAVPEKVEVAKSADPEVDLSPVPESVRAHVDAKKYASDPEYKRGLDHGWKPKELFLAEGGDEADWTGYRQFNRRYDDRQEKKELKKQIGEVSKNTEILIKTINEEKQKAVTEALAKKEAELKTAIDDGDAARAVQLQRDMQQIQQQSIQPQQQGEPAPVIDWRAKNPMFNRASAEFNAEINAELEMHVGRLAKEYHQTVGGRQLSYLEIKGLMDGAYDMVKDKIPAKQETKAQPTPVTVAKPSPTPAKQAIKLNKLQKEVYDKLKESNSDAAERYLKKVQSR